jgi:hypothetical protein
VVVPALEQGFGLGEGAGPQPPPVGEFGAAVGADLGERAVAVGGLGLEVVDDRRRTEPAALVAVEPPLAGV